ncbi:Protein psiG, partial [Hondaea fermentalgiana]
MPGARRGVAAAGTALVGAIFSAVAVFATVVGLAQVDGQQVTYSVTFRDFLPAPCVTAEEYCGAWGVSDADCSSRFRGIQSAWFAYDDPNDSRITGFGVSRWNSYTNLSQYCPYWDDLRMGTISGHPDFEADSNGFDTVYGNGPSCQVGEGCTSLVSATVSSTTATATSGLPKVQPCGNDRCGKAISGSYYTLSNVSYFDSWYNDNAKYNKRLGRKIVLTYRDTDDWYEYDAADSEYDGDGSLSNPESSQPYFTPLQDYDSLDQTTYSMEEAPAWPHSYFISGTSTSTYHAKFWYTTEIQTYFEYRGGERFRFDGDDDVWVFINDYLVVDLGGYHPSRTGYVDVDDIKDQANLTLGETYSFSMFHAERHTDESNFKITTTLASTCNVVQSGSSSFTWESQDIATNWFLAPAASWDTSGSSTELALISSGSYLATPSYAYLTKQQNVGAGFVIEFEVQLTSTGLSEGFALVLHDREDGLDDLPVSTGEGLGYRFLTNAVAIAFDLCADRAQGSCSKQEVAIHFANELGAYVGSGFGSKRVYDGIMRTLRRDDETHT